MRGQEVDDAPEMVIGVAEESREHLLHAREQPALVGVELVPRAHAGIRGRQLRTRRHHAHFLLSCQDPIALDIPAVVERARVARDELLGHVVRIVAGTEREVEEERPRRVRRHPVAQVRERVVDEVFGEVVAGVGRWFDAVVVVPEVRHPLIGAAVQEAVVVVEAAPERPMVERAERTRVARRREVPLADAVVRVVVVV